MNWKNRRLKTKIAVTFIMLFSVTLFILAWLTYVLTTRENKNRTLDLVNTSITQMSTTIDLYIQDMERLSLSIFSDPIIQRVMRAPNPDFGAQYDSNEMSYRLIQFTYPWPYIQGVYLFAEDGRTFNMSKGSSMPFEYSIRQEPWYSLISTEREPSIFYWPTGPESTATINPEQVFSLIRSIHDITTGKKLGYLKIDLHVQVMKSILFNAVFRKDKNDLPLRYMLLDSQEHVMFDSQSSLTGQQLPGELAAALANKEGKVFWSGKDYLYSTNLSKYNKWMIIAITPYSEVVKQSVKIRNLIVLLGAVTLLLVGIASYLISVSIVRPLSSLIMVMKRVERGDFKVRAVPNEQQDEIGLLSRVFNLMLESVDRMINQVFQSNIREKDAQVMALQAQINPHMLFNTLNIMKALSRKKEAHDVADLVEDLAELFRYSMKGWSKPVMLAQEMDHVESYIRIQQTRFQQRLSYHAFVPSTLMNAQVVKISIQPLVENAIIHGLEKRMEGCTIELHAHVRSHPEDARQELEISVTDTGVGMSGQQVRLLNDIFQAVDVPFHEVPESKSGIGLLNIHKRIRLLFGVPYGLRVESEEGVGTRISLHVPYWTSVGHEKERGL
ncbi:sensor histidine kinase YesM [Paenibacillus marchantiophytorum]|uniref:histidine kinase n=1 Tax=Paenibacillus marchantiophytorum TaxID=1619310 RepID=A0ABQ1FIZ8_9BACL|nr:sensor histidine kinase [Paenibacillus marchantiophytorum]GGA17105.1 sensor histidine kinase YesM [Paenibacillus marchantiophytorum]